MGVPPRACTQIYTMHLEQAFETLLEEMKLDTDVLDETFTECTVACAYITMLCCVTAVCLCKIIEKSVMG